MKVIIVGGVAGGASAATRLRRNDEQAEIIMFERGEYISFANCGLPYYIGDVIQERDSLLVQTPESMKDRFNIDVRISTEVTNIDRINKTIKAVNLITQEIYEEAYDYLILSPGSSPLKPPIPGIDGEGIFTIWNIPDTDSIKHYLNTHDVKNAAVIGGGFIGIEMAENLAEIGVEVSLVELADQIMAPLDHEMAQILHQHVNMKGVELFLSDGVKSFVREGKQTRVLLNSGREVKADMVILSIGVKPNGELATKSGLEVNERGGIVVDNQLKTSDKSIFAVGDAIQIIDYVHQTPAMIPLAGPANKQGRIVADIITGREIEYEGTQGTSVAKVFNMTVATTGTNEKLLIRNGKVPQQDYDVLYIHPNDHASYYPDASRIHMKVLYDLTTQKILGAQGVGLKGVEKRIDVIATVIRLKGTVTDLTKLELAYAPPYGSAKDPVNMAGYVAENMLSGLVNTIRWPEAIKMDEQEKIIVDVRDEEELMAGQLENAINIPLNQLRSRIHELDQSKKILLFCSVGQRGYVAARMLQQHGFNDVRNIHGGLTLLHFINYIPNQMLLRHESKSSLQSSGGTKEMKKINSIDAEKIQLNCSGLQCPGPIMKVFETLKDLSHGELVEVTATDMGFAADIKEWCLRTGNTLLDVQMTEKGITAMVMKGLLEEDSEKQVAYEKTDKSMVVFSGDLDKVLASFIIANGAASMGRQVTMFFTFWGLNALRKPEGPAIKKPMIEKMFGWMMPKGAGKLSLSKMHMGGMGTKMMKVVMKQKNVDSLEKLLETALKSGVRIVACTMSMDVMGIKEEELIDGVEYGGVASFLAASERSDATLFI